MRLVTVGFCGIVRALLNLKREKLEAKRYATRRLTGLLTPEGS
jgi:hypothetical protein